MKTLMKSTGETASVTSAQADIESVLQTYETALNASDIDTELQIEEIEQVATNWAFVRTSSVGFVTVHANDERVPDANHELFVFQKDDDDRWKIARYCFSTTNPLRQ